MRTLTLLLMLNFITQLCAQNITEKPQWIIIAGFRSMPIPVCNCYFEPTEFELQNRTGTIFFGGTLISKLGFSIGAEGGYYKRSAIETDALEGTTGVYYYNQGATFYKSQYLNTNLGYTFGQKNLKLSLLTGVDFHFEKTDRIVYYSSQFFGLPNATSTFPTVAPYRTAIDTTYNSYVTRSQAFLLGLRLTYEVIPHCLIIGGWELQAWPTKTSDENRLRQPHGSYRIGVGFKF